MTTDISRTDIDSSLINQNMDQLDSEKSVLTWGPL
jgi:hypothetical protein